MKIVEMDFENGSLYVRFDSPADVTPAYEKLMSYTPEQRNSVTLESVEFAVRTLVHLGKKIDAIKLVRVVTLMGLKEAKDYVESLPRNDNL